MFNLLVVPVKIILTIGPLVLFTIIESFGCEDWTYKNIKYSSVSVYPSENIRGETPLFTITFFTPMNMEKFKRVYLMLIEMTQKINLF